MILLVIFILIIVIPIVMQNPYKKTYQHKVSSSQQVEQEEFFDRKKETIIMQTELKRSQNQHTSFNKEESKGSKDVFTPLQCHLNFLEKAKSGIERALMDAKEDQETCSKFMDDDRGALYGITPDSYFGSWFEEIELNEVLANVDLAIDKIKWKIKYADTDKIQSYYENEKYDFLDEVFQEIFDSSEEAEHFRELLEDYEGEAHFYEMIESWEIAPNSLEE